MHGEPGAERAARAHAPKRIRRTPSVYLYSFMSGLAAEIDPGSPTAHLFGVVCIGLKSFVLCAAHFQNRRDR